MMPSVRPLVYTVVHSTRSIIRIRQALKAGRVEPIVDIRSLPRSGGAAIGGSSPITSFTTEVTSST